MVQVVFPEYLVAVRRHGTGKIQNQNESQGIPVIVRKTGVK